MQCEDALLRILPKKRRRNFPDNFSDIFPDIFPDIMRSAISDTLQVTAKDHQPGAKPPAHQGSVRLSPGRRHCNDHLGARVCDTDK